MRRMRGDDERDDSLFSYVRPEERIPADHPLRPVRRLTDEALRTLSPRFARLYARIGRPSIPPEQLLRALLLQSLYSIRSERLLVEQLQYNLLFRWFVGLSMDGTVWSATTFSKNRERLLEGDVAAAFFDAVVGQARAEGLLSDEHFTVDGTQLEAWASLKSFQPVEGPPSRRDDDDPGNPTVNFRGERRTNQTHRSTTDPDAQLFRKGLGEKAVLAYLGHALLDNRHGLVVNVCVTSAGNRAEREAAQILIEAVPRGRTVGADKGYDVRSFVEAVRAHGLTPHVAHKRQYSAIDGRTTRHAGYDVSQRKRKLVEQVFGWLKTVGLLRKLHHRGCERVDAVVTLAAAAYNLTRMRRLLARPA